jgi:hypothetical protein
MMTPGATLLIAPASSWSALVLATVFHSMMVPSQYRKDIMPPVVLWTRLLEKTRSCAP